MFRVPTQDRKKAQERRNILDEQFKKERVELSDLAIKDEELKLCEKKVVKHINRLQLNHNQLTYIAMETICTMKWTKLARIELMSNSIGNKGCKYLSKMSSAILAEIYLNNNQIDSSGVSHLSKAQWPGFNSIVLYYNKIGDGGVQFLLKTNWANLSNLHLSYTDIKPDKKRSFVLGSWRKIKILSLNEDQEDGFMTSSYSLMVTKRYPKVSLNVVTMIRHQTA